MNRRTLLLGAAGLPLAPAVLARPATAQNAPFRVGLILSMTGPFASTGKQIEAAVRLYARQNPAFAGRPVEILLRDDGGAADATRRLAQELVVNERVSALAGFVLTPHALAAAPIAARGRVPMVVMSAATATVTEASPFVFRTSQTTPQVTVPLAGWAAENGIRKAVTVVSDYGPGLDAEKWFGQRLGSAGGTVAEALRVPLANPDFAPFLQRARDATPEAVFVFVPAGVGSVFMRQFAERGLKDAGIRLIALGDVLDDDILNGMGDPALGVVSSHHYSAAHDSEANRRFVAAFREAAGMRPNFMAAGGYDGMTLLRLAAEKAGAGAAGQVLADAMKGLSWESPRGPVSIDAATRDIVQNVYIRRVERQGGELYNVEIATVPAVKDPAKAAG
ncbi:ABC transporter substrate-binding protein [Pararoseomonas sp. SCSIO 73927]|uniref:ABC transporter substrate-binding protein n=1 Tax=Pararoseomonas sp. SCSIO 73927 TaxID=3114537 RepID=UPI0030D43332